MQRIDTFFWVLLSGFVINDISRRSSPGRRVTRLFDRRLLQQRMLWPWATPYSRSRVRVPEQKPSTGKCWRPGSRAATENWRRRRDGAYWQGYPRADGGEHNSVTTPLLPNPGRIRWWHAPYIFHVLDFSGSNETAISKFVARANQSLVNGLVSMLMLGSSACWWWACRHVGGVLLLAYINCDVNTTSLPFMIFQMFRRLRSWNFLDST